MTDSNDVDDVLFRATARTDALRAGGLRGLEGVTRARQASLEREHARLSAKVGADDPRTRAIGERLENGASRLRELTVEIARAEIVGPRAGADQWILFGYVRYESLDPAPDLTVTLVDSRGQPVQSLGFACTDARGYFRIVAQLERVETELEVYISVSDRDRAQLYRGEDAIPVASGNVEYREIILGRDTGGCATPEKDAGGPEPRSPRKEDANRPPRGRRRKQ
jgi:hypothetical protein